MIDEINAIEDIDAFWKNLGSRNKLYKVEVNGKIFNNMELVYERGEDVEKFKFVGSEIHGRKK